MKTLNKNFSKIFAAIIISSCLLGVYSTSLSEEDNVLVLTDSNFDEALSQHKLILVEFYAPWCGHCKALAPEYAKAAGSLKEKNSEIRLAKVDATAEKGLSEKFNIEGFPTLKFFKDGKPSEYNGGRKAEEIVSWLEKKSGPAIKFLETKEQLNSFIESFPVVVVFFGSETDSRYSTFKEVADNEENFPYGVVSAQSLFEEHGAQANDIVLFKQFDEKKAIYDRNDTTTEATEISEFVHSNSMPLVTGFNEATAEFIFGRSKTGLFLYRDPSKDSKLDEIMKEVAPEYRGKIYFVACGISEDLEEKLAEYIGVTEADLPVLKIHEVGEVGVKKYTLKKPISKENIREFLSEYLDHKLPAEFKSEEVPETQDPNTNVVKIVGKNWNQVVLDTTKDVLVKFYAPWCGHCQALAPKWENLAKKLAGYKNIVIGKIDATVNEVEGEEIEHYPTLRFYSHKNKVAEDVDGRHEYEFLEFLRSKELVEKIGDDVVFEKPVEEEAHDHQGHDHEHEHEDEAEAGETDDGDVAAGEDLAEVKPDL